MAFRRKQKPSPSSKTYEITFINLSIHEITILLTWVKSFIYSIFEISHELLFFCLWAIQQAA